MSREYRARDVRGKANAVASAAVILVLILPIGVVGQQRRRSLSGCENSTVDDNYAPDFAERAKQFLENIKGAVSSDNKGAVASLVNYPIRINQGKNVRTIGSRDEFIHNYSRLITSKVKAAVVRQSSGCLFANSQGVMIGDGEVWFAEIRGKMKIIALNLGPAVEKK